MKRNLAVYFSGRILDYEINKPYFELFKKHFETKFNIDFFCSINSEVDNYHQEFITYFNISPYRCNFETYKLPENKLEKNYLNMFSMFYNNKKCVELIERSTKKYDVVLRYRTEVRFHNLFEIPEILQQNTIYIPGNFDWGGINDQIAYGNLESMKKYTELYDNMIGYNKNNNVRYHPETMLLHHLKTIKIHIVRFIFHYRLMKKCDL